MDVRATISIPARLHSERLSQKPLRIAGGKSLISHTIQTAFKVHNVNIIVIADDAKILDEVFKTACFDNSYRREVPLWCGVTVKDAWCGTHRLALAIAKECVPELNWRDIIINLQCDEPNIKASDLDKLIDETECSDGGIATLVAPLDTQSESDSSIVKAIVQDGKCVDFRRTGAPLGSMHHVGCYGFKKDVLLKIGELEQSERSQELSLEQLTWLDNGYEIDAVQIDEAPLSVNTMADYEKWVASFGRVLQ